MTWSAFLGLLLAATMVFTSTALDLVDEHKISYCDMLIKRRVYRDEKLDVFCLLKVQEWDNQVKIKITKLLHSIVYSLLGWLLCLKK